MADGVRNPLPWTVGPKKSDIHVWLDAETHAAVTEAARRNGRSLNEEINLRLHGSRPERITELLEANNREVGRRGAAENVVRAAANFEANLSSELRRAIAAFVELRDRQHAA